MTNPHLPPLSLRFSPIFLLVISIFLFWGTPVIAQDLDDLLDDLSKEVAVATPVKATFKSPRVINGHSVEMVAAGDLEYRISHRFGRINSGSYNLWGLDQATIRNGLDLGVYRWLNVGLGRSSFEKTFDGYVKVRALRQMEEPKSIQEQISLSVVSGMMIRGLDWPEKQFEDPFSNRYSYFHEVIVARKMNTRLSLQLTAMAIHQNFVERSLDQNLRYAIAGASRLKLTNRLAVTAEYFARMPYENSDVLSAYQDFNNTLSLGFDIETGGHVFQLHFTNARAMFERGFAQETQGKWSNGDIYFGFNITRNFTL